MGDGSALLRSLPGTASCWLNIAHDDEEVVRPFVVVRWITISSKSIMLVAKYDKVGGKYSE